MIWSNSSSWLFSISFSFFKILFCTASAFFISVITIISMYQSLLFPHILSQNSRENHIVHNPQLIFTINLNAQTFAIPHNPFSAYPNRSIFYATIYITLLLLFIAASTFSCLLLKITYKISHPSIELQISLSA